ncbi:hypothetical protein TSH100_21855 [Azospirillum sp. TSH100]|uniref:hypothetical protein n=1 Tax=Azospirillum sp. TSH100 TaxID=652764 RepID=UPI000D61956D|nr:hypothetical protein [Azospirillum sp. TSH100]PWC83043.1 hypothetical protein TSH100_21855 [Azospirillum sp. TSH100]QCG89889.1 hypothetical protein E6C72_19045 [Azospirillum sp. TSH100]
MDRKPDETILTAHLPNLEIQIRHREAGDDGAEVIAIQFRATPSFDAVAKLFAPTVMNPLLLAGPGFAGLGKPAADQMASAAGMAELWMAPMRLWGEMMRQAWAPWLQVGAQMGQRR